MDLPDGAHPIRIILVCILVACVFCLTLSSVVPLHGYCGARNNNRCCVTVYMGFSLLAVPSFLVGLLQHGAQGFSLWSLVFGCLVPGPGFYYSYRLREIIQPAAWPLPLAGQAPHAPSAPPPGTA
ncbi:unnamed protein product [Prorocentrum cordatum]|uniref:Transmembrane 9 superfamily member n=1 Tax=Prorocentrum cordatum TaxID=2364126 RepID=A0ABN9T8Z8_9DINO|nr:unnamed protein product [Polarella glacialis]